MSASENAERPNAPSTSGASFVAENALNEERVQSVREQLELVEEFAGQTLQTEYEKRKVYEKIEKARADLS